jgi:hypothetical protein
MGAGFWDGGAVSGDRVGGQSGEKVQTCYAANMLICRYLASTGAKERGRRREKAVIEFSLASRSSTSERSGQMRSPDE